MQHIGSDRLKEIAPVRLTTTSWDVVGVAIDAQRRAAVNRLYKERSGAAGIEFIGAGQAATCLYPGGTIGPFGAPGIRVAARYAEQARDLLKELE